LNAAYGARHSAETIRTIFPPARLFSQLLVHQRKKYFGIPTIGQPMSYPLCLNAYRFLMMNTIEDKKSAERPDGCGLPSGILYLESRIPHPGLNTHHKMRNPVDALQLRRATLYQSTTHPIPNATEHK
jgi:hypothetical protein